MGMAEVAAYLRIIRRGRGYTQESLAEAVDTSKRTIERLERAEGDITVQTFLRIVTVLHASGDHLAYLASHSAATVHEAEALARGWLRGEALSYGDEPVTGEHGSANLVLGRVLTMLPALAADQLVEVLHELSRILYEQRSHVTQRRRSKSAADE